MSNNGFFIFCFFLSFFLSVFIFCVSSFRRSLIKMSSSGCFFSSSFFLAFFFSSFLHVSLSLSSFLSKFPYLLIPFVLSCFSYLLISCFSSLSLSYFLYLCLPTYFSCLLSFSLSCVLYSVFLPLYCLVFCFAFFLSVLHSLSLCLPTLLAV